jgi:transcriptional regulator with XRE-family HTH domain
MRCAKAQRNEAMTAARLALGLSQLEVADKIGMMGPNYNIYESNNPKALVVKKDGGLTLHALRIADFYGLSPAALWPLDVLLPPLPPEPQWNALDLAAAGLVPSESPMADARSRSRERVWLIELTLATLKPREEDVLRRRFGFDLDHHESHKEIGKRWSLSHSRIQQIERKALRKLRHPLRVRKLRALYPTP